MRERVGGGSASEKERRRGAEGWGDGGRRGIGARLRARPAVIVAEGEAIRTCSRDSRRGTNSAHPEPPTALEGLENVDLIRAGSGESMLCANEFHACEWAGRGEGVDGIEVVEGEGIRAEVLVSCLWLCNSVSTAQRSFQKSSPAPVRSASQASWRERSTTSDGVVLDSETATSAASSGRRPSIARRLVLQS